MMWLWIGLGILALAVVAFLFWLSEALNTDH